MEKIEKGLEKLNAFIKTSSEYLTKNKDLASEYMNRHLGSALEEVLKEYWLQIEDRHKIEGAKNEEKIIVIHYTSIAVLISILKDACYEPERENKEEDRENSGTKVKPTADYFRSSFRLYDSVHLNDPDEGNYLVRYLKLFEKYDWLKEKKLTHAYIASFILPNRKKDMSDNLVFWRGYGQEGEGCSLSVPILHSRLYKVIYGSEVKPTIEVINPVLESLDSLVATCNQSLREDVGKKLAEVICKFLEKIRYLYKSEAYDYEKECRFVIAESEISDKSKICFDDQVRNNSPTLIRHYHEHNALEIKELLTTDCSITLGPCVPQPYNMSFYLYSLLRRANFMGPKIKISGITYRNS